MSAVVVASPTAGGRTRCRTLRSAPPISLRETAEGLFLVASGAGPIGGDALHLDVTVDRGASLLVRSAAASLVLPGPSAASSTLTVTAHVEGALRWVPEPTVAVAGADHTTDTRITLARSASVVWREELVLGRHGEPSGSILQRLRVELDGAPLLRTEVPVGPRWSWSGGPAGTAGATAIGSLLVVGCGTTPTIKSLRGCVLSLGSDAWFVTAATDSAAELRSLLDEATPAPRSAARQTPRRVAVG